VNLSIQQRQALHGALVESFADYDELNLATDLYLGDALPGIAPEGPMPIVVMKAIRWAETRGRLPELIDAARQARPQNPALLTFVQNASSAVAAGPAPPPAAGALPPRPALERVILMSVEFAHTAEWRANMAACERAVCRIESPVSQGIATGFLIGPDLLMTNYHVVPEWIEHGKPWADIACRFGYAADAKGVTRHDGEVYRLAPGPLVASSKQEGGLDYAILRLERGAGDDPIDGTPRGYLRVGPNTFESGEPIFIIQHPLAAPLRVTTGAYVGGDASRVRYQANTMKGSSGSPCFNANWKLVALHSAAEVSANTGVPMTAILSDLAAKGLSGVVSVAGS
jgi:V8-like Glu-specific endopeptidase